MSPNEPTNYLIRSGSIEGIDIRPLDRHADNRGWLVEFFRNDKLPIESIPQMAYLSETLPGVVRGPHEHEFQSDLFLFFGPGDFQLYLWDARPESSTYGSHQVLTVGESNPRSVIIPPGVVHAYKNISHRPAWVFNAPNRLYGGVDRKEQVDEIRHEDSSSSPYRIE